MLSRFFCLLVLKTSRQSEQPSKKKYKWYSVEVWISKELLTEFNLGRPLQAGGQYEVGAAATKHHHGT